MSCLWAGKWGESSLRENYFSLCICYFVLFDFFFSFFENRMYLLLTSP